jgi:Calx-beta domain
MITKARAFIGARGSILPQSARGQALTALRREQRSKTVFVRQGETGQRVAVRRTDGATVTLLWQSSIALSMLRLAAAVIAVILPVAAATASTAVTIQGEKFLINGVRTFAGGQLDGTLPNSRMVQATFDDANPATVGNWKYPNGSAYSATRQTNEFIAALPSYRAKGLLAVTVNFQGGDPISGALTQPWDNTAFNSDGSLKPDYLARMDHVIRALDAQGMVAILGYFYFGQVQRLSSETAIKNAVTNATQWVLTQGYTNVLIEIDNEANSPAYPFAILQPGRVSELISAVQTQSANFGRRLYVGVSFTGGTIPPSNIVQAEDFILLHGNGQTSSAITSMVNSVRALASNKPIVFNEDSTSTANFQAATNARASWGYFDAGANNYVDGFQSPPTNWHINTVAKQNFFNVLANLTGGTPPPAAPTVTVSASPASVAEGGGATFVVSRSLVSSDSLTVFYTVNGTARLGIDYTLSGSVGQVVIPAGQASAEVSLQALNDAVTERKEKVKFILSPGVGYTLAKGTAKSVTVILAQH